jgi:hypothetical protein
LGLQSRHLLISTHLVALHRKLLREDEDTPMSMFFGFMGLLIFVSIGPILLVLW